MKVSNLLTVGASLLLAVSSVGCACKRIVSSPQPLGRVDDASANKGYVEFYSVHKDYPIPVLHLDERNLPHLKGLAGLHDAKYLHKMGEQHAVVGENLRVSAKAGEQNFMIERDGEILKVPVTQGKITPVELEYKVIDNADSFVIYTLDWRVFEPVAFSENRLDIKASPKAADKK